MPAVDSFVGDGLAPSPYKEALARAERAEAKVAYLEEKTPAPCGWPWDSPYMDGYEAAKDEYRGTLAQLQAELDALRALLVEATEVLVHSPAAPAPTTRKLLRRIAAALAAKGGE